MRQKTKFQDDCSRELLKELKKIGLNLTSFEFIDGNEESFYKGELNNLHLWIYEDGTCIKIKQRSYIFEKLDYKTLEALRDDFINKVIIFLKNENPGTHI